MGQLLVAANQTENINEYVCKKNEDKLIVCLYNKSTGEFQGLSFQLAYIILRGDKEKSFFSYGVNNKKSTVLYSEAKDRIPNAIILTRFKKHYHEIMNEIRHNEESSSLFFFLPSITDRKEKINQFRDNVNPQVELLYNFFRKMAETSNANLIRKVDYLLPSAKEKRDNSEIVWVGPTKQRYDSTKFKLTY